MTKSRKKAYSYSIIKAALGLSEEDTDVDQSKTTHVFVSRSSVDNDEGRDRNEATHDHAVEVETMILWNTKQRLVEVR